MNWKVFAIVLGVIVFAKDIFSANAKKPRKQLKRRRWTRPQYVPAQAIALESQLNEIKPVELTYELIAELANAKPEELNIAPMADKPNEPVAVRPGTLIIETQNPGDVPMGKYLDPATLSALLSGLLGTAGLGGLTTSGLGALGSLVGLGGLGATGGSGGFGLTTASGGTGGIVGTGGAGGLGVLGNFGGLAGTGGLGVGNLGVGGLLLRGRRRRVRPIRRG